MLGIGATCGVRPSSLGWWANNKEKYLRWKDIRITREPEDGSFNGRFTAKIIFKALKGQNDYADERSGRFKELELMVTSAQTANNIPSSPTHRMLAIIIRRKLLTDYKNIDELLAGDKYNIEIREEALEDPVFYSNTPRGLGLSDKPAAAMSFSNYMKRIASVAGYGQDCTMYAWRRKAGTEAHRAVGLDKAKNFMSHAPGTSTFEKYYDEGEYDLDVTAIILGEDHAGGGDKLREQSHPSLFRCQVPTPGGFLEQSFVSDYVRQDPEYRNLTESGEVEKSHHLRKKLRRMGITAFREYHSQMQKRNFTMEELQQRKLEMKEPSKLMSVIREKASQMSDATTAVRDQVEFIDDEEDDEDDEDDEILVDMEDEIQASSDNDTFVRQVNVDNISIPQVQEMSLSFMQQVKLFMSHILEETKDTPRVLTCSLCEHDESVSDDTKYQLRSPTLNTIHQNGPFHNGISKFRRMAEIRRKVTGDYQCPFPDCSNGYKTVAALVKHVRKDVNGKGSRTSAAHKAAVYAAGWADADFHGSHHTEDYKASRRAYKARENPRRGKRKYVTDLAQTRQQKLRLPEQHFLFDPMTFPIRSQVEQCQWKCQLNVSFWAVADRKL